MSADRLFSPSLYHALHLAACLYVPLPHPGHPVHEADRLSFGCHNAESPSQAGQDGASLMVAALPLSSKPSLALSYFTANQKTRIRIIKEKQFSTKYKPKLDTVSLKSI